MTSLFDQLNTDGSGRLPHANILCCPSRIGICCTIRLNRPQDLMLAFHRKFDKIVNGHQAGGFSSYMLHVRYLRINENSHNETDDS